MAFSNPSPLGEKNFDDDIKLFSFPLTEKSLLIRVFHFWNFFQINFKHYTKGA